MRCSQQIEYCEGSGSGMVCLTCQLNDIKVLVKDLILAERKACAELAKSYGHSRPPVSREPQYIHRYEGECAASANIAKLILNRGVK